jgi:hypothetical protein
MAADDARKAFLQLPPRQPPRLSGHNKVIGAGARRRANGSIEWLHKINGDPFTGKGKRAYREELGLIPTKEDEEDAQKSTEYIERLDFDVVVENPAGHGMPRAYLEGLSEIEFSATSNFSKDELVTTRWEVHGRHTGRLLGVPATNRDVSFSGMTILRFEEGPSEERAFVYRATDEWTYWDLPAVMEQIGATP